MTSNITINPLPSLVVSAHSIPACGGIPNTSIQHYPLLIYRGCIQENCSAPTIERHLREVGAVTPQWRYTMYSTSHFHSTTHEVLCIAQGSAQLLFGGEDNPGKVEVAVKIGDVIVIPAGVAHRLTKDIQGNFEMVGSYPAGAHWDMCYGKDTEEEKTKVAGIKDVAWFKKDPVYGEDGPVLKYADTSSEGTFKNARYLIMGQQFA